MRLPAETDTRRTAGRSALLGGWKVTWFGHATFLVASPGGVKMLFDPWITENPACPPGLKRPSAIDLMLISHGHSDHCGDAVALARDTGATVVSVVELAAWLERQGVKNIRPMNIGGRQTLGGVEIVMVQAVHSSSTFDANGTTYLGPATGFVVRCENAPAMYFAGDTALFGDMRVIGDRFAPGVAFLPIGDRYTMGPEDAATAAEWLRVKAIIPMHYGTFPELTGTPDELRKHTARSGLIVIEMRPGETV
jgi:L-ascorbate metabolism protein UlaG (beta-lactamase superfamily)